MKWLVDNWTLLIVIISALVVGIYYARNFAKKPSAEKLADINEWLLYAVMKAEHDFGNGTGALKLRKVYDMFISKFPEVSYMISFKTFSDMVDIALIKMREILEKNKDINEVVTGINI